MKKIVTIVGARPQFIKVAPVSRILRNHIQEVLVNTGQHYDYNMAEVFFGELQIPRPDYNLGVGSGTHGKQTGDMLIKIEEVLLTEEPQAVLVYGDTNSTLAGALSASKLHIPIIHVEAGLRSFNRKMPEEINRVLTDHLSSLLFPPTELAVRNLELEGIDNNVYLVGDVMYDAVLHNIRLAREKCNINVYGLNEGQYYLATIHRAENTDNPQRLRGILESLSRIEYPVLLPLHPRTRKKIVDLGFEELLTLGSIRVIDPVSYLEMLVLESSARGIITDSGGVQKEAYFAEVPCYTIREETEWVETVDIGWNRLINPNEEDLAEIIKERSTPSYVPHLYGDGNASFKIVERIIRFLEERS